MSTATRINSQPDGRHAQPRPQRAPTGVLGYSRWRADQEPLAQLLLDLVDQSRRRGNAGDEGADLGNEDPFENRDGSGVTIGASECQAQLSQMKGLFIGRSIGKPTDDRVDAERYVGPGRSSAFNHRFGELPAAQLGGI